MKVIDLATNQQNLMEILQQAESENLILRTSEGKEFIVAETEDFDQELALVRNNQELLAFLDKRTKPEKTYTMDEVRKSLGI